MTATTNNLPVPHKGAILPPVDDCLVSVKDFSSEAGRKIVSSSYQQLSFDTWEQEQCCPHCGYLYVEVDLDTDCAVCDECGCTSEPFEDDFDFEIETRAINDFDRFDFLELFERDHVGGE